jgi:hypothetical protein
MRFNLAFKGLIKFVYCWGKHVERESVPSSELYSSKYENKLFTIVFRSEIKFKVLETFYYHLRIIYYNGTIKSRCNIK